ncbi:MAG: S41 family peptidase [Lachnospira sp.]|nr:S41 family peptidase [Lachnospira sp.]
MDNQNYGPVYGSYDEYKKNNPKKKSSVPTLLLGVLLGAFITVTLCVLGVSQLVSKGYIHLGVNGEIYVTGTASDESEGIGSKVAGKLNALNSVLSNKFYFDQADEEKSADSIYKAYLSSYDDKYTVYYTADEYKKLMESTSGKFYGVGALCSINASGGVMVLDAFEDGPAYKAGVRDGDVVIKVDDTDITGMDLSSAVALIKGDKGTQVNLTIVRDDKTYVFSIIRDEIITKTVDYKMMENSIGYIQISQFDEVTTEQFKEALTDLNNQGLKGLIVDIRSNPGGLLNVVVDIVDEIIPKGLIVYTDDVNGNRKEYNGSSDNEITVPMAVLVDGNSASAAEIFAGAVQDYGKGKIIGTQTFGKGIVQTIQPLTDGSAIKYTIAQYYTPKGQVIQGNGVTPNMVVELPKDATEDLQLDAALEYVKGELR